ncbi:hypothetical protein JOF48_001082 [Arthrobacter stackebrandtii]|uniref:Uncharacterized protein n=1 Tax=Arthrobacter stackebrandtii TaxID=272161 RepID=A0ABS4YU12_9MICC|nr:hypothetical protein [Arthrobacter stackebrandtii]MBP2412283.1 hypothetical protein [Arthrobacter stackebrandtii]
MAHLLESIAFIDSIVAPRAHTAVRTFHQNRPATSDRNHKAQCVTLERKWPASNMPHISSEAEQSLALRGTLMHLFSSALLNYRGYVSKSGT